MRFDPYDDEPVDHDEQVMVAKAMIVYGGDFVKWLGEALLRADSDNARKVRATWPAYWNKYLAFGQMNAERERE